MHFYFCSHFVVSLNFNVVISVVTKSKTDSSVSMSLLLAPPAYHPPEIGGDSINSLCSLKNRLLVCFTIIDNFSSFLVYNLISSISISHLVLTIKKQPQSSCILKNDISNISIVYLILCTMFADKIDQMSNINQMFFTD